MRVAGAALRDFRCYESATLPLGEGLTVIAGPNGAGKTNLLEALYFGSTGRSCRTNNEREVIRFGASATRVQVRTESDDGWHELAVGFQPGEPKRLQVDGAAVERLLDHDARPLLSVFLPDRLELVKGAPSLRRAHLDQFVAALWPARAGTRRAYAQTLAQRNALISRIRSGRASADSLGAWDQQLAAGAMALMEDRHQALSLLDAPYSRIAEELGLEGRATIAYRPRSRAKDAEALARELAERAATDVDRGFTGHGPHRDEISLALERRELRAYGSQGQQRLGLLSLLLAEREVLASTRDGTPLMLLDDVMSELDRARRESLVALLQAAPGQSVITTTDLDHVPGVQATDVAKVGVRSGMVLDEVGV